MSVNAVHAALAVSAVLVMLGLYGTYLILGARYNATDDLDHTPWRRDPAEVDTEPWPAPR